MFGRKLKQKDSAHYLLDHDQPTTCPKCGTRTFYIQKPRCQWHACISSICKFQFIGLFERT